MAIRRRPKKPTGMKGIESGFKREISGIRRREVAGVTAIGLLVKKWAQIKVPARIGNLRSSAFLANKTGESGSSGGFDGVDAGKMSSRHEAEKGLAIGKVKGMRLRRVEASVVGFSADYALPVHENPRAGSAGYSSEKDKPGLRAESVHSRVGGWKYLQEASNEMAGRAAGILAKFARIR